MTTPTGIYSSPSRLRVKFGAGAPTSLKVGEVVFNVDDNQIYLGIGDTLGAQASSIESVSSGGTGGGAAAWGDITGVLSDQTDLQSALNAKAAASHSHTQSDVTGLATALAALEPTIAAGASTQYWRGDKSWQDLNASAVGLGNVDNTSDANKPISTATQTALDGKASLSGSATFTGVVTANGGLKALGNDSSAYDAVYVENADASANSTVRVRLGNAGTTSGFRLYSSGNADPTLANLLWLYNNNAGIVIAPQDVERIRFTYALTTVTGNLKISGGYLKVDANDVFHAGNIGSGLSYDGTTLTATAPAPAWGAITGTLSNQTDLNTALNAKADASALSGYATTTALAGKEPTITAGTTSQYWRGDKSWQTLDKTAVGLSNVTNVAQQPSSTDLTAIAALAGTSGLLKKTGAGTWALDTTSYQVAGSYLTANQTITLSGDVSGSGSTAITTSIGANKVTRGMLAATSGAALLGSTAAGNVSDLTGTQVTTLLDDFTSTLKGVVPASGGGTSNFLRADGTWAAPPSGSGSDVWTRTRLHSDYNNATVTFANITDGTQTFTFTPTANTDFIIEAELLIQTTSTTNMPLVRVNMPALGTGSYGASKLWFQSGAAADTIINTQWTTAAVTTPSMAAGTAVAANPFLVQIVVKGHCGSTPGAISLQFACESAAASTCFVKAGSEMRARSLAY